MKAGDIIIWRHEKWRVMEVDSDPTCCAWCVNLADPDGDAMIPPHEVEAYVCTMNTGQVVHVPVS